ncbi:MAG TPA: hypothetical protein VMJ49_06425 [Gaiellaceae bacterium]|nr:hypothetical protein [Gaiellaceae bacterium]
MPRVLLVAAALTVAATSASAASSPKWSGSASCTISVTGSGYQHSETQKWAVAGPTTLRGAFRLVPSHWTDTGSGSSHVAQGDQTRDITWTVSAAAPGQFQFVVRASDKKLVIGQANAQLRVAHGITGTQKQTIGGVAQNPGPVDLEAFETQLPPIVARGTATSVSGSMPPTTVHGSFGPFQPGAATVTKSCSWKFARH